MSTSSRPRKTQSDRLDRASGYVQPGRVGKKPLVGYFDSDAHRAVKQLSLDLDRKIEDLMEEAFHDLLMKLGRASQATLFKQRK